MTLATLSRREADIFACLAETVVAPAAPLPPVRETDAVASFDRQLTAAPALNRNGLRGTLLALELGPRLARRGGRLRRLPAEERLAFLRSLEASPRLRPLVQAVAALAQLSYYGDDGVMRLLGYDPDANLARARALRANEGRW
jgi:hypothetical protein